MLLDIRKIISPEDIISDFAGTCEKLDEIGEGYIFQRNKPTHVIMTLEHYQRLLNGQSGKVDDLTGKTGEESLEVLLNKIGKKIFVDYYEIFKEDNRPEEHLPDSFSLNSKRSRSSSARKIFREQLQIEALNNIIKSSRLDEETLNRAKELLTTETDEEVQVIDTDFDEVTEIKIGKAVRMFFSKIAQMGIISVQEIENLTNTQYAKNNFNLNFAVLKHYNPEIPSDQQKRDARGYNRYYDSTIRIGTNEYFLCSQWVENLHRDFFEKWLRGKMKAEIERVLEQLDNGVEFTIKGLLNDYWFCISRTSRKQLGKDFYQLVMNGSIQNVTPLDKHNGIQVYKKF